MCCIITRSAPDELNIRAIGFADTSLSTFIIWLPPPDIIKVPPVPLNVPETPEYTLCKLHATVEVATKIVKYMEKKGAKKMCRYNENEVKCIDKFPSHLLSWHVELRDAKNSLKILNRIHKTKRLAPKKVIEKISG